MRSTLFKTLAATATVAAFAVAAPSAANAADTDCAFTEDTAAMTMTLTASCTTDASVVVPDGWTLDGDGHTITAADPVDGHFVGGVIAATSVTGGTAHVRDVTVTTDALKNAGDGGEDRLRGIYFRNTGGSITGTSVTDINQGASGAQEGNAIEVRSDVEVAVAISHNVVADYQKSGIVVAGPIEAVVAKNSVSASATQENLAANSVQFSDGATGELTQNRIDGNQWMGTSNWVATAVLMYGATDVLIEKNHIGGNSDIGLYLYGDDLTVTGNKVLDEGTDHPNSGYDIGVGDWGVGNVVTKNHVGGFETNFDGVDLDANKVRPVS